MTRKEAIEIIKTERECVERNTQNECDRDCINCDLLRADEEIFSAYDMAIEALEKEIPIRPIMRIEERGLNKGCIYPHCPICDTMPVPHPNVSYCDKCGQAIDWSELE